MKNIEQETPPGLSQSISSDNKASHVETSFRKIALSILPQDRCSFIQSFSIQCTVIYNGRLLLQFNIVKICCNCWLSSILPSPGNSMLNFFWLNSSLFFELLIDWQDCLSRYLTLGVPGLVQSVEWWSVQFFISSGLGLSPTLGVERT